jgi:hypothetical protein
MKESMDGGRGALKVAALVGALGVFAIVGYYVGFFGPEWLHPVTHSSTFGSVSYDAARLMVRMWITGPAGALGFLFMAMVALAIWRRLVRG